MWAPASQQALLWRGPEPIFRVSGPPLHLFHFPSLYWSPTWLCPQKSLTVVCDPVCTTLSSVLFSLGNHNAFHFKGLLLITIGEEKSAPRLAVTINTGKLQTWRNPSKFTQHWSPGYSYGFLLKWYLKTTFDFCSFFLFLKLELFKSFPSRHRHSDHPSPIRIFVSEQPSFFLISISCQMGPWAII